MSDRRKSLYDHQHRALDLLRQSYALQKEQGRPVRTVLMGPTGMGKTVIMATMTRGSIVKGKSVAILVPRKQLIEQTLEQLADEGITSVGVIQADHYRTNGAMPVQVCTPQSLQNRPKSLLDKDGKPRFGLVLVDECHEQFRFIRDLMQHPDWQGVPFVGVSATPWARGMGTYWNDLVIPTTTEELIATTNAVSGQSFLAPFKVFAPPSGLRPDLSKVATSNQVQGTDYVVGQLSTEMRKAPLVADAVSTWKMMASNRKTLVFAVDRAHADALHTKFCEAGVHAEYIDGNTPMRERTAIRKNLRNGRTQVVVNIGVLTTGCDWPEVDCIQLCRPTRSESLLVQIVGRGLRPSPGKDFCLVLDHTMNTERLGLVTDICHTLLDDGRPKVNGKAKPAEALPKECPSCHHMKPPKTRTCPSCGHEAKVQSKVETVNGKLEEVKGKKAKVTMADKQLWWSGFLRHAQVTFKSHKWCLAQYRQKFNVWPRGLYDIAADEVSPEIAGWIKSRAIAWANRRTAEGRPPL